MQPTATAIASGDPRRQRRVAHPEAAQGLALPGFPGAAPPLAEKALTAVVQEAYVHGVSTRSVDDLVQAIGMSEISKSQMSRPCAVIDEKVNAFLSQPIEGDWPYLCQMAASCLWRIVAVAVNIDGPPTRPLRPSRPRSAPCSAVPDQRLAPAICPACGLNDQDLPLRLAS